MPAPIVQAEYDVLEMIAQRFNAGSERNAELQSHLTQSFQALANGGWQGRGIDAFVQEMEGELFPAVQRLTEALGEAGAATQEISGMVRAAEEEAASLLQGDDRGTARGEGAAGALPGAGGEAGAGAKGGSDLGGSAGANPALPTPIPTADIFNDEYMLNFIGKQIEGADDPRLNELAEMLLSNPSGQELTDTLNELADLRGVRRDEFRAQYDRFLALGGAGEIDLGKNGEFLGSTASLRYGQVVGDALGVDPLFGALLNPTGGFVGPGDTGYWPGDNDPIGYHGIFHDAAGYLYNYHNVGPGYDYLGQELGRDTSDPLTGQRAGILWWLKQEQLDPPGPDFLLENPVVPNLLGSAYDVIVLDGKQIITGVGGAVSDIFQGDIGSAADNLIQAGTGAARVPLDIAIGLGNATIETAEVVGGAIVDGAEAVGGAVVSGIKTIGGWFGL